MKNNLICTMCPLKTHYIKECGRKGEGESKVMFTPLTICFYFLGWDHPLSPVKFYFCSPPPNFLVLSFSEYLLLIVNT